MTDTLTALILLGPEGPTAAQRWVAGARLAAARDAAELAALTPGVGGVVLAAPERDYADATRDWPVTRDFDVPGTPFHFGARLSDLLQRYPAKAYLYLGAGSLPLLPAETLAQAVDAVRGTSAPLAITNNLHSSDWMAFNCPAAIVACAQRLPNDNALGWVLRTEAGVDVRSLPPSAGTRLDIDTPADLLLLERHPRLRPALRGYLAAQPGPGAAWAAAGRRLFAAGGQVALMGRVSSARLGACRSQHAGLGARLLRRTRHDRQRALGGRPGKIAGGGAPRPIGTNGLF